MRSNRIMNTIGLLQPSNTTIPGSTLVLLIADFYERGRRQNAFREKRDFRHATFSPEGQLVLAPLAIGGEEPGRNIR
jgi:hypothetical protein